MYIHDDNVASRGVQTHHAQSLRVLVVHLGFKVQGSGCRVQGSGCRVQGLGFRVQGAGFRVED